MADIEKKVLIQEGIPLVHLSWPKHYRLLWFSKENSALIFEKNPDCQVLIIRANFTVNEISLQYLPNLTDIGLVSSGLDAIDNSLLQERNIRLYSAKGKNARAVFEYTIQAILLFLEKERLAVKDFTIGIIGRGRIGSLVYNFLEKQQVQVCFYDPLLKEQGDLKKVLAANLVSLHVPLSYENPYATFEMLDENYFSGYRPHIINSCRGKIWQRDWYEYYLENNLIFCQDVYPEEPPSERYVKSADFSSPHIAGYSTKGRLDGVTSVVQEIMPDVSFSSYPESTVWSLEKESSWFKSHASEFSNRREFFVFRKEFFQYTEEEFAAFRKRFSALPLKSTFFSALCQQ